MLDVPGRTVALLCVSCFCMTVIRISVKTKTDDTTFDDDKMIVSSVTLGNRETRSLLSQAFLFKHNSRTVYFLGLPHTCFSCFFKDLTSSSSFLVPQEVRMPPPPHAFSGSRYFQPERQPCRLQGEGREAPDPEPQHDRKT